MTLSTLADGREEDLPALIRAGDGESGVLVESALRDSTDGASQMNTLHGIAKYSAMAALLILSSGCVVGPERGGNDGRDHDRDHDRGGQYRDEHRCDGTGHDEHCHDHDR